MQYKGWNLGPWMFNMPSIPLGTCPGPQRLLSQFLSASHQALAMQSVASDLCQEGPGNDSPKSQAMGGCKSQISTASPLPVLFFFLSVSGHPPALRQHCEGSFILPGAFSPPVGVVFWNSHHPLTLTALGLLSLGDQIFSCLPDLVLVLTLEPALLLGLQLRSGCS